MGKTSFQDLTGNKYGRLTVIALESRNHGRIKWKCKCECGNVLVVMGNNLKNGHTQSCGCYRSDKSIKIHTVHGGRRTRLYNIWTGMKTRCYDKNCHSYKDYGNRGITVCVEWLGKEGFNNFREWALSHGYNEQLSIDRINVNQGYNPSNCRWVSNIEQANNTRASRYITVNGVTKTTAEWEKETGIKSGTIRYRIDKSKMSPEEAISKPLTQHNGKLVLYKGEMRTLTDIGRELNIDRRTLKYRLEHGIPIDKELNHDT